MIIEESSSSNQQQTEKETKKFEPKYIGLPNQGLKPENEFIFKSIRCHMLHEQFASDTFYDARI